MMSSSDARALLAELFEIAVERARPGQALAAALPSRPAGRTIVVGAGKAAAHMAQALETAWDGPLSGLVVTSYGNALDCRTIEVIEAAHPVPDEAGLRAAAQMMTLVSGLTSDDLVIALISGGGSALLPAPAQGLTLADEQAINQALLASGASIDVMNLLRSQFSTIKGGRLAALCAPARMETLVISDIPGDDPALVSSGPTVPFPASRERARQLATLYRLDLPPAAQALLGSDENLPPEPGSEVFAANRVRIIASAAVSLDAAAEAARRQGLEAVILSDSIEGEARDVAGMHAAIAREIALRDRPFRKPVVLLSGGETTVTLRGQGRGGRNAEFALALALALKGVENVTALAADTDGIDGRGENAGAFVDPQTVLRMRGLGLDPLALLANNDSYSAFEAIGDLFVSGPTGTNVNDFRAILVE